MEKLSIIGIAVASVLLVAAVLRVIVKRKRKHARRARRQRNIAHRSAWEWLYGRSRTHKRLTYRPEDPAV
ncbi:hypothetical protein [Sphingosinithalassobacter portus]|uniref:hypothetical protein n=1 Tax=Stakelama portus TaxID=2676234 RepID=UPI000D6EA968|nr:hypothetical protein [Sphingosinithalassobacter portus]